MEFLDQDLVRQFHVTGEGLGGEDAPGHGDFFTITPPAQKELQISAFITFPLPLSWNRFPDARIRSPLSRWRFAVAHCPLRLLRQTSDIGKST